MLSTLQGTVGWISVRSPPATRWSITHRACGSAPQRSRGSCNRWLRHILEAHFAVCFTSGSRSLHVPHVI